MYQIPSNDTIQIDSCYGCDRVIGNFAVNEYNNRYFLVLLTFEYANIEAKRFQVNQRILNIWVDNDGVGMDMSKCNLSDSHTNRHNFHKRG